MRHWIERLEDCRKSSENQARWSNNQTGSSSFEDHVATVPKTMLGGCGRLRHINFCNAEDRRTDCVDPTQPYEPQNEITILFQRSLDQAWRKKSTTCVITRSCNVSWHTYSAWVIQKDRYRRVWSHVEMVNRPFTLKTWCLASGSSGDEGFVLAPYHKGFLE